MKKIFSKLKICFLNYFFPIINTKQCNVCRSDKLVLLRSTNEKICSNCNNSIYWKLDEGQQSLISNNRLVARPFFRLVVQPEEKEKSFTVTITKSRTRYSKNKLYFIDPSINLLDSSRNGFTNENN